MASSTTVIEAASETSISDTIQTPQSSQWEKMGDEGTKKTWTNHNHISPLISLSDVMSEQLADTIIREETQYENFADVKNQTKEDQHETSLENSLDGAPDTSSDEALALLLQSQMDKEYNEYVAKEEARVNQHSKVKLSFNNYRIGRNSSSGSSHDDSDQDSFDSDEEESFESGSSSFNKSSGTSGKTIVTKHDKEVCSRRNAGRMEDSFPVGFTSGDARGNDIQLTNKIYNSLKQHAFSEQRRGQRLHEAKEHYTTEHAVDEKTRLILYRLVSQGILASINGIISVGKESIVIHADGGDAELNQEGKAKVDLLKSTVIPKECAIKIFKTTLNEFRTRDKYIKDDYRFKERFKKLNPRKIIHMWAEKEMRNLIRIKNAGIRCPEVILLRKHVLVMSYLGTSQRPAPKLKEAVLSNTQKKSAYTQVKEIMKNLYHKCKLVHSDLSEYNLLWNDGKVWVIDVSQAVEPNHPHGLEFLYRDCQNISRFFKNNGVEDVAEPMRLFNDVSGLNLSISDRTAFLSEIERLQNMSEEHSQQGLNKSTSLLKDEP